ncbi:MAG: cobyric acid synthase, partial [Paenibacillus macerans]|nr:cobyric acid synthase [Paenibacillus macerans]
MENRETVNGAVLMVQGTASDVGKSVIVTALCRIFAQDGFRTAPFKSQNMALNSYVTPDGREIGRAQGVQAEACGIAATTDMNPVLIKPTGDMHSQIVVHGQPLKRLSAADYREKFLPEAKPLVMDALNRLRRQYDIVLMEGAGSPAEINLKQRDIVNMNLAGWADAPVILVGDIDRGGVFAFLVGTLELLEPEERARVKGFIINKFRGDLSLLQPGLDWLERRTGIPVLGVLPYLPDLDIEAEDSVVLDTYPSAAESAGEQAAVDIAVIRYPRISNFTDFAPLAAEPDV